MPQHFYPMKSTFHVQSDLASLVVYVSRPRSGLDTLLAQ